MIRLGWKRALAAVAIGAGLWSTPALAATIELSSEDMILYAQGNIDRYLPQAQAKAGNLRAQYLMAFAWLSGRTKSITEAQAKAYLTHAAEGNLGEAQSMMALLLYDGKLFPKDDRRAFQWGLTAAEQGDGQGQAVVAAAYDQGRGVRRDRVEALKWYLISACQHMSVEDDVVGVRKGLTEAQQQEAYARVYAWKERHPDVRPLRIERPLDNTVDKSLRPARQIAWKPGDPGQVVATKVGGAPWWPAGRPRPVCHKGHRLSFMAQIKLSDVPGFDPSDPTLLSFHYCDACDPWGNGDKPDAYDLALLTSTGAPDGLGQVDKGLMGPAIPVYTQVDDHMSLGDIWETPLGRADFDASGDPAVDITRFGNPQPSQEAAIDRYPCIFESKLGGWPMWEQSAAWPTCEEHQRMLFVGQFDSHIGHNTLWGGGGYAYLFICPPTCKHRRAELIIQTS